MRKKLKLQEIVIFLRLLFGTSHFPKIIRLEGADVRVVSGTRARVGMRCCPPVPKQLVIPSTRALIQHLLETISQAPLSFP